MSIISIVSPNYIRDADRDVCATILRDATRDVVYFLLTRRPPEDREGAEDRRGAAERRVPTYPLLPELLPK